VGLIDKFNCRLQEFIVHSFHALFGQRTGILYFTVSVGVNNATWAKILREPRLLGVILILRFLFRIQVI